MLRQIVKFTHVVRRPNVLGSQRFIDSCSGKPPIVNNADVPIIDYDNPEHLPLPEYPQKLNESLEKQKQRLLYQSRKRGMLENDLLLSTFASKFLNNMNKEQTDLYDQLINGVTNDWDIYYWATNTKPTPQEYDNEIMKQLKIHVSNEHKEKRIRQPDL